MRKLFLVGIAAVVCLMSCAGSLSAQICAAEILTFDLWEAESDGLPYRFHKCVDTDENDLLLCQGAWFGCVDIVQVDSYQALADRLGYYLGLVPAGKRPPVDPQPGLNVLDAWSTPSGDFRLVQLLADGRYEFQRFSFGVFSVPNTADYYVPDGADRMRFWFEEIPPGKRPPEYPGGPKP